MEDSSHGRNIHSRGGARPHSTPRNEHRWQTTVGQFRGESSSTEDNSASIKTPIGRPSSEHGYHGRFNSEEKKCFKRIPVPSLNYEGKAEVYWQTTGELRKVMSESGLHTLPALKGDFFQRSELKEPLQTKSEGRRCAVFNAVREHGPPHQPHALPIEAPTARILEMIYPKDSSQKLHRRSTGELFRPSETWQGAFSRVSITNAWAHGHTPKNKARDSTYSTNVGLMSKAMPKQLEETEAKKAMMDFRRRVLEKYLSVQEAFDSFDIDMSKQLTLKEWNAVLAKSDICSHREARLLFDHIDKNRDGNLSVYEFHVAIEAVAPVRTLEDVRKRWLAHGFPSMHQAIQKMVPEGYGEFPEGVLERRLSLQEFGALLSKAHITDPDEHLAVFNIIRDPGSCFHGALPTVSMSELASAISTVSPSLLLEDLRDKMLLKYNTLGHAYDKLDMDKTGHLEGNEFVMSATRWLNMSKKEAIKAFQEIDIDGSHCVSKAEFIGAFNLSEPSLLLEDFRKKVLQRFRSIFKAFQEAFMTQDQEELDDQLRLGLDEFAHILAQVDCTYKDTQRLFKLIDVDKDGSLTVREFAKGIRLFAPSCVLDNLRMRIVTKHATPSEAFVGEMNRHDGRTLEEFAAMLAKCNPDLTVGVPVKAVFQLLDVKLDGNVSLSELIAALQSGQPGTQVMLPRHEREMLVKQAVKTDLQPFHKCAGDLKQQVRTGLCPSTPEDNRRPEIKVPEKSHKGKRRKKDKPKEDSAIEAAARAKFHQPVHDSAKKNNDQGIPANATFEPAKQSYQRFNGNMRKMKEPNMTIVDELKGYYLGANKTLAGHSPLLLDQQSRFQLYRDQCHHQAVLMRGTRAELAQKLLAER